MAEEAILEWRAKWDTGCPLMIGVAYTGWESGSDAGLREELKRIRETGFTAVRVRFDREGDIEKMAGMVNWRNPDRFFDAAEKAGLKVWCAPGTLPHGSLGLAESPRPFPDEAVNNVTAWIRRFVGQYRDHPALFAWIIEAGGASDYETGGAAYRGLLLQAFNATDFSHPVLLLSSPLNSNPLSLNFAAASQYADIVSGAWGQAGVQGGGTTESSILAYTSARLLTDTRLPRLSYMQEAAGGASRGMGGYPLPVTPDAMTRLLLAQIAAGVKGVLLSHWKSARRSGSVGESSLLDWLDRVTPAAQTAGRIAQAADKYRQELWRATFAPQVHILCSRRSDDLHARLYRGGDTDDVLPSAPQLARLGAARTLLNANVPFTFLSDEQLLSEDTSLAPVVFLPHMETLPEAHLLKLKAYAENGGRVVADMPTGYLNENGELLNTQPGSPFEQLFGASVAGLFNFSNPAMKEAETPRGQTRANLVTTTARAGSGTGETPAFTENRVGRGRAVLVNLSLSLLNAAPNLQNAQLSLLSYILGSKQTALPGLSACLVFRRTSEQAEHVFLLNDSGEERTTELAVTQPFTQAQDAITEETLPIENNAVHVPVPAGSGRWIRLSK